MEALIHTLVALPLALGILWDSRRFASLAVRVVGMIAAVVAFVVVLIGSYWIFLHDLLLAKRPSSN